MANATHAFLWVVGPTTGVTRFCENLAQGVDPELGIFDDFGLPGIPLFHRMYRCEVLGVESGPRAALDTFWDEYDPGELSAPEECFDWPFWDVGDCSPFDRAYELPHDPVHDLRGWEAGESEVFGHLVSISDSIPISGEESVLKVKLSFRLFPPPGLPFLARIYPECRFRLQFDFEFNGGDWLSDYGAILECAKAGHVGPIEDHVVLEGRVAFDSERLVEELRIGDSTRTAHGITNGIRVRRSVSTRACARRLIEHEDGELLLPSGREQKVLWVFDGSMAEPPVRSICFGLSGGNVMLDPMEKRLVSIPADEQLGQVQSSTLDRTSDSWTGQPDHWGSELPNPNEMYEERIPFRSSHHTLLSYSPDFRSSCEDNQEFGSYALQLLSECSGDGEQFITNMEALQKMVVSGHMRVLGMICENEYIQVDVQIGTDFLRWR